ncbi:MAG: three-Cys-motif partner protein TcmP, partial [Candidatus Brocadiae bacterium]|nr:three-Cys-motif partner protein TcmP [Candidatus Brocadiia bacterium]
MGRRTFFDEPTEKSQVKTHIVNNYFGAWARVIIPHVRTRGRKLAYIDLFSGPGRYEDGTPSTPLLVLQQAVGDKDLCDMLVTLFNDRNQEYADRLVQEINSL